MRIVVCVKQVPGVSAVRMDPETKRLVREGVAAVLNPFDYYALEEAVRLRELVNGEVIAVCMGPPKAEQILREAIAFGADRGVLLSDRRFGGSDTWATSYVLAGAIRKIGAVDLVLCGKQAIDGDTAQVGPGIAAHLSWGQVAGVQEINVEPDAGRGQENEPYGKGRAALEMKRLNGGGYDICKVYLPAVVAVTKEINQPRVPRLQQWRKAAEQEIPVWNAEDIGADPARLGLQGSLTRVVSTTTPELRQKDTKYLRGVSVNCARELLKSLCPVNGGKEVHAYS